MGYDRACGDLRHPNFSVTTSGCWLDGSAVRYKPDYYLGADRVGSLIAEREGLTWAFLGLNDTTPERLFAVTVCCHANKLVAKLELRR